ncbi:N-acetylmuramoyl-L-alanine amidase family protein [Roseibacillus ishigakijimensis]|uniref:N-acetylmuramoyl-L-alanine amidase n=1 Tax=Roseibacillus ishigakijimensis TaxID=454146 RepID=A0A934RPN3_9BACT|nr:N-acetylmuramoyl-L-alanine amidase [Roseibacillus ishigakijimensis]MBK1833276.1 N-acetylmuramoyl-L-alanine amidase [Roseibacillus ishigakijimensis]
MKSIARTLVLLVLSGLLSVVSGKTIIIDAGHGGHDIGGHYGKVYEKHLALDTAMRLEYYLKRKGYRTVMIRDTDRFVPLAERSRIANKYRDAIFISIHYNYTWKSHVQGLETFYCGSHSRALAEACHQGMQGEVRAADRGVKYARYHVIRHCKHPSILIEGGFLSHSGERQKVMKGSYRDQLVRGIVDGIVRYDRSGKW